MVRIKLPSLGEVKIKIINSEGDNEFLVNDRYFNDKIYTSLIISDGIIALDGEDTLYLGNTKGITEINIEGILEGIVKLTGNEELIYQDVESIKNMINKINNTNNK